VDGAIALAARVLLALVLVVAATAKLRARGPAREATVALIGARVGGPVATALPFVELALAIALVVWWSPVPGVVAVVLLLGFTAVLVRAALRRLPCPCFGGAARRAAGGLGVLRNAVLVAVAVLATATP
jgi:hypothetical protein